MCVTLTLRNFLCSQGLGLRFVSPYSEVTESPRTCQLPLSWTLPEPPGECCPKALVFCLPEITFQTAFIIQTIKGALCNKQTHNSDCSTKGRPTPLPFVSLMKDTGDVRKHEARNNFLRVADFKELFKSFPSGKQQT